MDVGNAVVGFESKIWDWLAGYINDDPKKMFIVPHLFSSAMAQMLLFIRLNLVMIAGLMIVAATNIASINVGQAWAVGTAMCFYAMYKLSQLRMRTDGVMGFCRSMGVPETEEMMFSYSWKVEDENIRTLGKAIWNAGVGVWVDVIKLTPGDEIRPVVRTMMRCVYRMVVFMSPDYAASPNCCVEWCVWV